MGAKVAEQAAAGATGESLAADTFGGLQAELMRAFGEAAGDADIFRADRWRSNLGRGVSAIAEGNKLWDRVFIGFSQVAGESLPDTAAERHPHLIGLPWKATGVSLVSHPASPLVPACHLNLRFFAADTGEMATKADNNWWFGGGFDLTPCYPEEADCRLWHQAARDAVEPFATGLYAQFKAACDRYFYLPHRGEMRGVGGLFFDDFNRLPFAACLRMCEAVGAHFLRAYMALVEKYRSQDFVPAQKDFQLLRRGRYAEFNLAFDRGTRFGLHSGGRTESILASLPPEARWRYDNVPEPGSAEAHLADFLQPRDWLA